MKNRFCIYTSKVRFHYYSFKKLVAMKRKLFEKKESDFIIVKENRESHIERHIKLPNLERGT